MKWYWLVAYSLIIPLILRPLFPNNIEFLIAAGLCGVAYGLIAAVKN